MERPTVGEKRRLLIYLLCCMLAFLVLIGRLAYIGLFRSSQWQEMAYEQQTRDRLITARRGDILDRNGVGIAETQTVAAVSVVPAEVKEKEETAKFLADTLELDYDDVLEKVQQKVALVRIQSKVDTETGAGHPAGGSAWSKSGRRCPADLSFWRTGGSGGWLCGKG